MTTTTLLLFAMTFAFCMGYDFRRNTIRPLTFFLILAWCHLAI